MCVHVRTCMCMYKHVFADVYSVHPCADRWRWCTGKSRDFKAREVKTHLHTSTQTYPHALLVKLFVAGFLDRQLVCLGPKLVTRRKRGRKEHDYLQVHPFYHILNIAFDRTRKTVFKI